MPSRGGATNRQRGDYFERQTRAALESIGWLVIRSAGSLGPADLVALRAEHPAMLVSCKLHGYLGPLERATLLTAAAKAGARPMVARRDKPGWVLLAFLPPDGRPLDVDTVKVPRRDP
jgi:Holliday junction resolvase